jgi:galactokinase
LRSILDKEYGRYMDTTLYLMTSSFGSIFAEVAHVYASAPGRINLIGEHTDYNEGFVLPMAIEQRTYVVARPMYGDLVRIKSEGFKKIEEFCIRRPLTKNDSWVDYVMGVADQFIRSGRSLEGFWALYLGEVPIGLGLSSSAALEVATALMLSKMFGHSLKPEETALLTRTAEAEFVGVRCGVMDQMTSLLAKEGHALFIDCRDLSYEQIPLNLKDALFVAVNTNVKRELGCAAYNDRRTECEEAAAALKKTNPKATTLRDAGLSDLDKIKGTVSETILKRASHVVTENERVLKAKDLLKKGALPDFGALMYDSHVSLKEDYEVSCKELDAVVEAARATAGVYGARLTGGGFGGCAVALLERSALPAFTEAVTAAFAAKEWTAPEVFEVRASAGAKVERLNIKFPEKEEPPPEEKPKKEK